MVGWMDVDWLVVGSGWFWLDVIGCDWLFFDWGVVIGKNRRFQR